ncbi:MAG: GntR family transcriptional regulator [Chloroflexi bacterium]|nr:GntR family transcriptional regulator [Chloroflexota bacterium]
MNNTPLRKASLANQIEKILNDRIKDGQYLPGEQIPTEDKFAEEFQVSRATIRAAFNALTANRLLVRRHGVGTFVSKAAMLTNPLDQSIDFLELISSSGLSADFREVLSRIITPGEDIREKLNLDQDQIVFEVHKIFNADGHPIVYSQNYIPGWVFQDRMTIEEITEPGATEPFFGFFRDVCRCEIQYYLSDVIIGMPAEYPHISSPMKIDQNTPILVIDETGYDGQDRPVNYAIEYLPGNRMQFSLVRKCLSI